MDRPSTGPELEREPAMLDAYLAARELERLKAERSAEFARQLPLYAEEIAYPPELDRTPESGEPDWATNY